MLEPQTGEQVADRKLLQKEFERYDFTRLKALSPEQAFASDAGDLSLAAHALTGGLEQALWHRRWLLEQKAELAPQRWPAIRFSLGVGYTRMSEYANARREFAANRHAARMCPRARFYFLQGLGFYRFFTAAYQPASAYAQTALHLATETKFFYGELLAEELLAHSLIEGGEVRVGLKHMRQALRRAERLGNQALQHSFKLLLLLNEARFGLHRNPLIKLQRALKALQPDEAYSRNAVKLELANQWLLRGNTDRAYAVLDEACDSIYASRNRRQIAQLNFRFAFLMDLRGRREEAMALLRSAELHLHAEVDHALLAKLEGLKQRLGAVTPAPKTPKTRGLGIHQRILARTGKNAAAAFAFGQDRIGDLYDLAQKSDDRGLRRILDERLYYFLYAFYNLDPRQKALLFDVLPRGVLVLNHGNIQVVETGFSRVLWRILEALAVSHRTKAELVKQVWGYNYDPERHDALVYTSVSKIRAALGPAGTWIEVDEKGYRLQSGVKLRSQDLGEVTEAMHNSAPRPALPVAREARLNLRQLRILARFDTSEHEAVGVDELIQRFQISRATATRDLSELLTLGYVQRLGRARATRYVRTEKPWRS